MIQVGRQMIASLAVGKLAVAKVCQGGKLVWQAVKSCFGSGIWRESNKWMSKDSWR